MHDMYSNYALDLCFVNVDNHFATWADLTPDVNDKQIGEKYAVCDEGKSVALQPALFGSVFESG